MPNKKAKDRKSRRRKSNTYLKKIGRTTNQVKKIKKRKRNAYN